MLGWSGLGLNLQAWVQAEAVSGGCICGAWRSKGNGDSHGCGGGALWGYFWFLKILRKKYI